jgi:hypothetical protein
MKNNGGGKSHPTVPLTMNPPFFLFSLSLFYISLALTGFHFKLDTVHKYRTNLLPIQITEIVTVRKPNPPPHPPKKYIFPRL